MNRFSTPTSEMSLLEYGPFDLALAGAASLLEIVGGGRLICDPRSFPIVLADPTRLLTVGLDNGHWPEST
ncbi:MAG TPA: hypothetical protein ENH15_01895 [Actinobacteria bacterium]|nr:hypothetical protein [Actinomycetota bacterium]